MPSFAHFPSFSLQVKPHQIFLGMIAHHEASHSASGDLRILSSSSWESVPVGVSCSPALGRTEGLCHVTLTYSSPAASGIHNSGGHPPSPPALPATPVYLAPSTGRFAISRVADPLPTVIMCPAFPFDARLQALQALRATLYDWTSSV